MKEGDRIQNATTKLIGTLMREPNDGLYYVKGMHELAGKWETGRDKLAAFKQDWRKW